MFRNQRGRPDEGAVLSARTLVGSVQRISGSGGDAYPDQECASHSTSPPWSPPGFRVKITAIEYNQWGEVTRF
jgi:hypothetical protein